MSAVHSRTRRQPGCLIYDTSAILPEATRARPILASSVANFFKIVNDASEVERSRLRLNRRMRVLASKQLYNTLATFSAKSYVIPPSQTAGESLFQVVDEQILQYHLSEC